MKGPRPNACSTASSLSKPEPSWQAITWLLERAYGRQFARPEPVAEAEQNLEDELYNSNFKEIEDMLRMM